MQLLESQIEVSYHKWGIIKIKIRTYKFKKLSTVITVTISLQDEVNILATCLIFNRYD